MAYDDLEITTNTDALYERAVAYIQARKPLWEDNEANFDVIVLSAVAQMAYEQAYTASLRPASIFKFFGEDLQNLPPIDPIPATGLTTWTAPDNLGYTIEAGTQLSVEEQAFSVRDTVVIPPGDLNVTGVAVVALADGIEGNGLTGTLTVEDSLTWEPVVVLEAPTAGGQDAEEDQEYEDRLVEELRLQAPRPIVPRDFEVFAMRDPRVGRATALDNHSPGVREVQRLTVDAADGTYTITHDGDTTTALDHDASADDVKAALQALDVTRPAEYFTVTGGPGATAPLYVRFPWTTTDPAIMTTDATLLTGGASTATIVVTEAWEDSADDVERSITVAVADLDGEALADSVTLEIEDYLKTLREVNFLVYVIPPEFNDVAIAYTAVVLPGFDQATVEAQVAVALTDALAPLKWGLPNSGDELVWRNEAVVHINDMLWKIHNVEGIEHVTSVTVNGSGSNLNMVGHVPLPRLGVITATLS